MFGYTGKILRIDLTTRRIEKEFLDEGMAKDFIGGFGFSARLLYDTLKPGVDPLSLGNALIVSAGALSGTALIGASKTDWSSKSPLTNLVQTALSSSFGAYLRWAGYDAVVVTGKAHRPSYLTIFNDEVKINDATQLWGKDTYQATDELWDIYGDKCSVVCIGPAGEKLAKISMGYVDKISTTGRQGSGAVFGSKNLKAIVVSGTKGIKVADSEMLLDEADELYKKYLKDPLLREWMSLGTTISLENYGQIGNAVWKNWRASYPLDKHITRFGVQAFLKVRDIAIPCANCPLGCKILYKIKEGEFVGLETPQSCNVGAALSYGDRFDLKNYNQVIRCHDAANRYGLDSIEVGATLDFLIDLQELGIIDKKVTDGMELKRDMNTVLVWMDKIAKREGFGDVLADGYPGLFRALGKEVEKYAIQRVGSSPDFDARGVFATEAFGGAVGIKGPHSQLSLGPTVLPGRSLDKLQEYAQMIGIPKHAMDRIFSGMSGFNEARFCKYVESWNSIMNMMGICNRPPLARLYSLPLLAQLYYAVSGFELAPSELLMAADRTIALLKLFNVREGATRANDRFPQRYFTEPLLLQGEESWLRDYYKTRRISEDDFEALLNDYYEERGWDIKTGVPTKETLLALRLEDTYKVSERRRTQIQ